MRSFLDKKKNYFAFNLYFKRKILTPQCKIVLELGFQLELKELLYFFKRLIFYQLEEVSQSFLTILSKSIENYEILTELAQDQNFLKTILKSYFDPFQIVTF